MSAIPEPKRSKPSEPGLPLSPRYSLLDSQTADAPSRSARRRASSPPRGSSPFAETEIPGVAAFLDMEHEYSVAKAEVANEILSGEIPQAPALHPDYDCLSMPQDADADMLAALQRFGDTVQDEARQVTQAGSTMVSRAQEVEQVPDEMYQAHLVASAQLRDRLNAVDLDTVFNSGDQNLCAIISLLQIRECRAEGLEERAREVNQRLQQYDNPLGQALREGRGIVGEAATLGPLMAEIFGDQTRQLIVLQPGAEGATLGKLVDQTFTLPGWLRLRM